MCCVLSLQEATLKLKNLTLTCDVTSLNSWGRILKRNSSLIFGQLSFTMLLNAAVEREGCFLTPVKRHVSPPRLAWKGRLMPILCVRDGTDTEM